MIFYTHERNFGCRITEHTYRGMRTLTLENERLRVSVLVDKGADIFEFLYKPLDVDFMWRSPWGIRNPAFFVPTSQTTTSGFLDFYEGGWQDCMPTGGAPCMYQGLPFGGHGETPTIPWEYRIMDDTPHRITVRFFVRTYRTPFYVEKDLTLEGGKSVLGTRESITNEGRTPMHLFWGQHPALGAPFVDDSAVIYMPGGKVHCSNLSPTTRFAEGVYDWPFVPSRTGEPIDLRRVPGILADTADTLKITDIPSGWYAVVNTRREVGFGMVWDCKVFPVLWFWQVYGGAYHAPWYGRTYNIALEPFTAIGPSLVEAMASGAAHLIQPGQTLSTAFSAIAFAGVSGRDEVLETLV